VSNTLRNNGEASPYSYWAFISYSSKDKTWGRWLHRAIETYGIPAQLIGHSMRAGNVPSSRSLRG
jgi:hypothetical protein